MSYCPISNFGCKQSNDHSIENNPVTYCVANRIDSQMSHGSASHNLNSNSAECQSFMSDYCANHSHDTVCQIAFNNPEKHHPNHLANNPVHLELTAGEILVRNTAMKKFTKSVQNGIQVHQPFDFNVAHSPLISFWKPVDHSKPMVITYEIENFVNIDNDDVLNRILMKPTIALDILHGLWETHKNDSRLEGTHLGGFYKLHTDSFN